MRCIISSGEPAGIGPDIVIQLAQESLDGEVVVLADQTLLEQRAAQLKLPLQVKPYIPGQKLAPHKVGELWVWHVPLVQGCIPGELAAANVSYVLELLRVAAQQCLSGEFDALVTAPVQKSIIQQAGVAFTGHTEFFAEFTHTSDVVMLLASAKMRVALVTTHLPLADVPAAITPTRLMATLKIVACELEKKFAMTQPRIAVSGLNPHAGENGHLGREEIDVIIPVLNQLRDLGMNINGPLSADTMFTPHHLGQTDVSVVMYHDQGLPVIKHAGFGRCVNITLGLPFVRTSVDHGTALSLAGTGKADYTSLKEAVVTAIQMAA